MLIKEMFIRSIENPEAIQTFMNGLLRIYTQITNTILWIIIIICLISYIIYLIVDTKSSKEITTNLKDFKQYFKQWHKNIKTRFTGEKVINIFKKWFLKAKSYLRKCRHFLIGYILLHLSRLFVSLGYWLIGRLNIQLPGGCSDAENLLLGKGSLYTLILFIIAPIVITFCFGNKFVRNTGIFIYILGICTLFVRWFLALGCPTI